MKETQEVANQVRLTADEQSNQIRKARDELEADLQETRDFMRQLKEFLSGTTSCISICLCIIL